MNAVTDRMKRFCAAILAREHATEPLVIRLERIDEDLAMRIGVALDGDVRYTLDGRTVLVVAGALAEELGPGELDAVDTAEGTSLYLWTDEPG